MISGSCVQVTQHTPLCVHPPSQQRLEKPYVRALQSLVTGPSQDILVITET